MLENTRDSKSLLAIVGAEVLEHDDPLGTPYLQRVLSVARASGFDVDLFHTCHDVTLSQRLFQSDPEVQEARSNIEQQAATTLADIALKIRGKGIDCSFDVQVENDDEVDAILKKIDLAKPALVMKQADGKDYILGLMSNTDWELTRQSPRNIWFVPEGDNADDAGIETILTAVGNVSRDKDIISENDYEVFRTAEHVRQWFEADNIPVHAYEVPEPLNRAYQAYAPLVETGQDATVSRSGPDAQQRVAEEHGEKIRDFAEHFGIDPGDVELVRGHPVVALPKVAESTDANLMILGARDLSRWERVVEQVTAEPILGKATCDVLFVKDDAPEREAQGGQKPVQQAELAISA